ncbi:MAG: ABC transporter permease [Deinococcales bacterium]
MRRLVPYLAWRHVRRRALQSSLTVVGVAVGVMVLITALSLTNGFVDELIQSTLKATPMLTLETYVSGETLANNPGVAANLRARPDVTAVAPFLSTQALIARRASTALGLTARQGYTQIVGIEPGLETKVLNLPVLSREASALKTKDGIVLGASLAQQLGVLPGDKVMLRDITGHTAELTVAGTFRVGNELIDGVASYMSLANLQSYMGVPGRISGYHLRLTDPQQAAATGVRLGDTFGLRPVSWDTLFSSLISQLRLQKAVIAVVVFLIVLVAALGIANILVLTVAEKTEEIAILRALGASARQVLAVFTLEGLLLGGAGTVLGALLGLGVSTYFRVQPYPLPGNLYFITELPVRLQWTDFAWVCGLSLATSVLAGLFPARRAADLDPVEILR